MKKLLFLMMATVLLAASSYGRTVSVASVEDDSHGRHVRANLSLSSGDDAVLYVAYGTADAGDDFESWDHFSPVGMLLGTTTSYSYEFPRDMGDDVGAVRFFLLEDYDIPLEKRYAYIETDGTQYVRPQFTPTGRTAIEMELSLNSVSESVGLFCARTKHANSFTAFYITGGGWRFDYFKSGTPTMGGSTIDTGTFYKLRFDGSGLHSDNECIAPYSAQTGNAGGPLLFFGSANNSWGEDIDNLASLKLRSLKVWSDFEDRTSILFDLIPTEKDGETCLYNRVDGTYLKSAVAGHPLTHGSEVAVGRPAVLSHSSTLTGSFGEERSMRVKAKHRAGSTHRLSSVDLALTTGLDRKLYVAYGANDGGADIADWPNVRYVGIIPGSTNEYSFVVPETWGENVGKMRLFLMNKEYIPGCTAVCEGVAVSNVYVATGFRPGFAIEPNSVIDMSVSFSTLSESQTIFCARESETKYTLTLFYMANTGWRLDYWDRRIGTSIAAETGRRYAITVSATGLKIDNVDVVTCSPIVPFEAGSKLALFVVSNFGRPDIGSYPFLGTLHSFKARNCADSSVDLDLVPCLVNGRVRLYNRVDGGFLDFGGSGTAAAVGEKTNGTVVSQTDVLPLFPIGFLMSVR